MSVHGEDASSFLQGQLSNDILKITENNGQQSLLCNLKGRTLAIFTILKRDDGFCLIGSDELIEPVQKRLLKYQLGSKVNINVAHLSQLIILNHPSLSLKPFETQKIDPFL